MTTGIALYFADGQTYFLGLSLVGLAALCCLVEGKGIRFSANVVLLLGAVFVTLSSIPASYWFYLLGISSLLIWIVVRGRIGTSRPRLRYASLATVLVLCVTGMLMEWCHRRLPQLRPPPVSRLYVIGDSLSAGMGGSEATWPQMLATDHAIEVVNLARPGATSESAMLQARGVKPGTAIVIIEIGGNDFFADLPAAQFEQHLDALLQRLQAPDRRLVMFELPIPLLGHRYGYVQRRLAARYDVTLIPRQVLARTIAEPGATVDGLHFSSQGHRRMADTVWPIIRDAIATVAPRNRVAG